MQTPNIKHIFAAAIVAPLFKETAHPGINTHPDTRAFYEEIAWPAVEGNIWIGLEAQAGKITNS